jgi:hypothetical protein
MKSKVLLTLLLTAAALPAAAGGFGDVAFSGIFAQPLPYVAQLSQEERRALRERWERATPEERAQLRRDFEERLRRMPSEQFDPRRMNMRDGWRNMRDGMGPAMDFWQDDGYGTGYEHRRYQEEEQSRPDRGNYDRHGRGRR